MDSIPPPPLIRASAARRFSLFVKIVSVVVLIALLHIPINLTKGVLRERQGYQEQAANEIAEAWGRQQLITGPVLAIPYTCRNVVSHTRVVNGRVVEEGGSVPCSGTAFFLPDSLVIDGTIAPELRHRGIYDSVVFQAKLKLSGQFQPDFAAAGIEADQVDWSRARVLFGVSDMHGVNSIGPLRMGEAGESAFEAADVGAEAFLPLAARAVGLTAGAKMDFSFEARIHGSGQIEFAPVGKSTKTVLQSDWHDPSFTGATLPFGNSNLGGDRFKAEWESSHFSQTFPRSWTSQQARQAEVTEKIGAASFGLRFARPVDGYSMVERAQKYAVLFFVLIFTVFFLFEITSALRIHPLQYAMVGAALCLFFLGFLALSEFWTTGHAYGMAAAACTALVSLYAWSFLHTGTRTLVIAGGLAATYGYLYFVLQSQDYALIAGTFALFAVLALVMFCTRGIDWYSLDLPGTENAGVTRQ